MGVTGFSWISMTLHVQGGEIFEGIFMSEKADSGDSIRPPLPLPQHLSSYRCSGARVPPLRHGDPLGMDKNKQHHTTYKKTLVSTSHRIHNKNPECKTVPTNTLDYDSKYLHPTKYVKYRRTTQGLEIVFESVLHLCKRI